MSHIGILRARIARPRFDRYVVAAGGEPARALRLYEWNLAASSAFFETLTQLEVLLRNALDEQLRLWHRRAVDGDGEWQRDRRTPLHPDLWGQVAEARLDDVLVVAGSICPTTAAWIWATTRVPAVLAARPGAVT